MSYPSIPRTVLLGLSAIILTVAIEGYVNGQTTAYHLHKETSSTNGLDQLKTAGPDAGTVALTSVNLKSLAIGEYIIKAFDTQSGIPSVSGVIPAASTVTFALWLKNTANVGTMFPRAKLNLNSATGASLCSTTGSTALTTTLTKYTVTCTTAANISMTATDRLYLWVGINLTAGNSSSTFQGSLSVEGTLNGNYDSQIVAPLPITPPSIGGLSVSSGPVGTSVTVNGSNFGATQDTSTLTFNGVASTPASWSSASIVAPVSAGATTGPVLVTVRGVPSNGITFTVTPRINSISPTSGTVGTSVTISGTTFGTTQGTSTVAFNGTTATPSSWSTASIAVPVPANATTGPVVVTVGAQVSNGVTFTVTPAINSISPTSGAVGTSIIISGTRFGATQGSSTITFNGTVATVSNWIDAAIVAPVPAGASTGPVVVTVGGQASNGVTFTLASKIDSLSPTSGGIGTAITITGTDFGTTQGSSTLTFNGTPAAPTSWGATSIVAPVPSGATTGSVVVTVGGSASNGLTFTVLTVGTISGRVTEADGTTPIPGATVKAVPGAAILATTNSAGDYTIAPIDAGTYTITASAAGYGTKSRDLVIVSGGGTATVNLSLDAIVNGAVSYIYDAAGRLISTVGPTETTIYSYDAVGNLLSITRQPSSQLSIISVVPSSGNVGQLVTINGAGFSVVASENTVQFNGTAAAVVSATNTRIITNVPSLGVTGLIQIAVTTAQGTVTAPFTVLPTSTGPSVELAPRYVSLLPGEKSQFIASVNGITGDQSVTWSVNGLNGGNADVGTISSTGFYASPNQPSLIFAIRATSVANPTVFGQAQVAILNPSYAQQLNSASLSVIRAAITDLAPITAVSVMRVSATETASMTALSVRRNSSDAVAFVAAPLAVRLTDMSTLISTQSASLSLTTGPYIQSVSPDSANNGTSFTLTINGTNLAGATALTFLTTSGMTDSGITASGLSVNPEGTSLTATVTVSAGTALGQRIVVVNTATTHSLEMDLGPNVIQINQ